LLLLDPRRTIERAREIKRGKREQRSSKGRETEGEKGEGSWEWGIFNSYVASACQPT